MTGRLKCPRLPMNVESTHAANPIAIGFGYKKIDLIAASTKAMRAITKRMLCMPALSTTRPQFTPPRKLPDFALLGSTVLVQIPDYMRSVPNVQLSSPAFYALRSRAISAKLST